MEDASADIAVEAFQGWICHARPYFPRCLARENIACSVDEVLWPDPNRRRDAASFSLSLQYTVHSLCVSFCICVLR